MPPLKRNICWGAHVGDGVDWEGGGALLSIKGLPGSELSKELGEERRTYGAGVHRRHSPPRLWGHYKRAHTSMVTDPSGPPHKHTRYRTLDRLRWHIADIKERLTRSDREDNAQDTLKEPAETRIWWAISYAGELFLWVSLVWSESGICPNTWIAVYWWWRYSYFIHPAICHRM